MAYPIKEKEYQKHLHQNLHLFENGKLATEKASL
jgi:hypothetical protein